MDFIEFAETVTTQFADNNIADIITIVTLVVTLIGTIATFALKFVKDGKTKKSLETTVFITNHLRPIIAEAEHKIGLTSADKKAFVMARIKALCEKRNIPFDEDEVSATIESILDFTKKVNNDEHITSKVEEKPDLEKQDAVKKE